MWQRLAWSALGLAACGGIAVIDDDPPEPVCFDAYSCCEAAVALMNTTCPAVNRAPLVCAIDTVPDTCVPFLGDVYRCIYEHPDDILCEGDSIRQRCGSCTDELEAAGEPCGQSGTCAP